MPWKDSLAALAVVTAWGLNFVIIKIGLGEFPPFLLGGLRFALLGLAAMFVRPPAVRWWVVVLLGATVSLGQFAFLFSAMAVGISAGLASVVLQAQIFFTVLIAAALFSERVGRHSMLGMVVAAVGLILIEYAAAGGNITMLGFVLTLGAALSWSCGNIVFKYAGDADMLSLVVWSALVPPLPFFMMSWAFEGQEVIAASLGGINLTGAGVLLYLALISSGMGYVLWGWLLARHPARVVAPLSLLVPVISVVFAGLTLGEVLSPMQWLGCALVMLALAINMFGSRLKRRPVSAPE